MVGTDFDPYSTKAKGNQDLLPWLATGLQPNVGFDQHVVEYPSGRVVIFQIMSATDQPVGFFGKEYVRIGSSKTELRAAPCEGPCNLGTGDQLVRGNM